MFGNGEGCGKAGAVNPQQIDQSVDAMSCRTLNAEIGIGILPPARFGPHAGITWRQHRGGHFGPIGGDGGANRSGKFAGTA